MRATIYYKLSVICFILGICLFAWWHEWIIIRLPSSQPLVSTIVDTKTPRTLLLTTWQHGTYVTNQEPVQRIADHTDMLFVAVNRWLAAQFPENRIGTLQSVLLSNDHIAYVSFTHSPLASNNTIQDTWKIIQGLLQTIHVYDPQVKKVQFLVQHQPMPDPYLDFTRPWPISGF